MYNSRPRYRSTSDFTQVSIPENYSGNAFLRDGTAFDETFDERSDISLKDDESTARDAAFEISSTEKEGDDSTKEDTAEVAKLISPREKKKGLFGSAGFGLDLSRLFKGGIGFEELLIIALILLMAEGDGNEDMIVLLALLLFIS